MLSCIVRILSLILTGFFPGFFITVHRLFYIDITPSLFLLFKNIFLLFIFFHKKLYPLNTKCLLHVVHRLRTISASMLI